MDFLEAVIYKTLARAYLYMEGTGRTDSFVSFPYLGVLAGRLTEEALEAWQCDAGLQAVRYRSLLHRLCGDSPACGQEEAVMGTALDLCLSAMYVPEFAAYLNYHTGNIVTIQLASELAGSAFADCAAAAGMLKKLERACCIDWKKGLASYAAIEGDDILAAYLSGAEEISAVLGRLFPGQVEWSGCSCRLHPMFIRQELAEKGARWLLEDARLLQISGRGGRRFLAKHIACLLGKDLILADAGKCHCWSSLAHAAFLEGAAVCIHGVAREMLSQGQAEDDLVETAVRPLLAAGIPVIVCSDTDADVDARLEESGWGRARTIVLTETARAEREAVFSGFAKLYQLPIDPLYHSVRNRLLASEIARAVSLWRADRQKDFSQICDGILYGGEEKHLGRILYPTVCIEDLKVPVQMKETLAQICSSVTDGYRLFEEWGLGPQYPYGRAVTVLLSGPPGTGKTMTAHVLARELGIALYQVDLSHVMDKYIGETEKHLEQIFTFAQRANPVLFFDEADALFGKRGEVADGRDRYANMEVSYILQRIEQFDGIVVLATNLYDNIDKAFLRRMKYVLRYQAPDAALRHSIWEACLPPGRPAGELDVAYLARQFDFTGGIIKNVVYAACVMALHEHAALTMEHVLRAVRAEYEKMERTVTEDMWGEYGYLMEEAGQG